MTTITMGEATRQTRLSADTLRYYEQVGLIGPIPRDETSGHRRYRERDLDDLLALACLRAMGVGIGDMRTYRDNRARGRTAAGEQRDLLRRHAERIERQLATLEVHRAYLHDKAELWDARDRGDEHAEAEASARVRERLVDLEAVLP